MPEVIAINPTTEQPATLPELTDAEKLAIRDIQYAFYLATLQQQQLQQYMMNISNQLQQKESELIQAHGLDSAKVLFDRDNLRFIERPPQ